MQQKKKRRMLVCPPPPWMRADGGNEGNINAARARAHGGINPREALIGWIGLVDYFSLRLGVEMVVMPIPERPLFDTVFPRDLYISVGDRGVMMSKMRALHRKDEPAFARSFLEAKLGLNVLGTMPYHFEGDSCLFELPNRQAIVFGHGSRADQRAGDVLRELFGIPVISVGLVEQFFHLDTAGTALSGRDPAVIFCREALSDPSAWEQLERACAEDGSRLIPLSIDDAVRYGSNVRVIDGSLVAPPGLSSSYWDTMGSLGYTPHVIGLGPLHVECGGFVACATNHFPSSFEEATIPDDCRWDVVRSSIVNSVHDYPTEEIV